MTAEAIAVEVRPYFEISVNSEFDLILSNFENEFQEIQNKFEKTENHKIVGSTLTKYQEDLEKKERKQRKMESLNFYERNSEDLIKDSFKKLAEFGKKEEGLIVEITDGETSQNQKEVIEFLDKKIKEATEKIDEFERIIGIDPEKHDFRPSNSLTRQIMNCFQKLFESSKFASVDFCNSEFGENLLLRFEEKEMFALKTIEEHTIGKIFKVDEEEMVF